MKIMRSVLGVIVATLFFADSVVAQSFSPTDKLLVLVTGTPLSTTMFGYSGQASLFQSTGMNADGTIVFSPVPGAQAVSVERNSATDFTNKGNYGTNGFIPPGIYFLHYHRLDTKISTIRHRLGLSDSPGGETILSTKPTPPVTRTALQFHVAFNNLSDFKANVSEGCITLTQANFGKLFPDAVFDKAQSPLAPGNSDPNTLGLTGSTSNVLVFVTDVLSSGKQDQQTALFDQIRKQLTPSDFGSGGGSQLPMLRIQWK